MEKLEVLEKLSNGEDSTTQLKENYSDAKKIGQDLVSFSNSYGGVIIIGVNNSGEIIGLSKSEIDSLNQYISNASSNNVKPPINVNTFIHDIDNKKVIALIVRKGVNKPYCDNDGVYWVRSGADKRKVTSPEELQRLFASSGKILSDEQLINDSSIDDLNKDEFNKYLLKNFSKGIDDFDIPLKNLIENSKIGKEGKLNLAGMLIFGKNPSMYLPTFIIKCVAYNGNEISGTEYLDSEDITGTLEDQYEGALNFIKKNLKHIQKSKNFNVNGELEISEISLEEIVQNAIIHRDYFRESPIRIFIFLDRIEIISPGKLPNNLSIDNIKLGEALYRNPIIASIASKFLKYSGLGTGISRALKYMPNIEFINDTSGEQFKVIIPRPN